MINYYDNDASELKGKIHKRKVDAYKQAKSKFKSKLSIIEENSRDEETFHKINDIGEIPEEY